jgi:chorismate mutase
MLSTSFSRTLRIIASAATVMATLSVLIVICPSAALADGDDTPLTNLIALSSQRLALAEPVARWKWAHHESITDKPREAELLAGIDNRAKAAGIDPEFAQAFFRDQIEASKDVQNALFDNWRKSRPPEGAAPDLARTTRPELDRITNALLSALARVEPLRHADDCPLRLADSIARWKHLTRYDSAQNAPLGRALSHVCVAGGAGAVG